ncbi:MAG: lysine--tRNA ligase [Miltoncostaeaceae bacterium]
MTDTDPGGQGALDRLIEERRAKAEALREGGVDPFPATYEGRRDIGEVRELGEPLPPGEGSDDTLRVAGRVVARRGQGKMAFLDIEDRTGRIQLWARSNQIGEESLAALLDLDLGDIVGAEGPVARTRRGELSLDLRGFTLLAKALRPPPDKHAGLKDPETRYRRRYLDLMADEEVRDVFRARAAAIGAIRRFLDDRGFIEVETPSLQPLYGGAAARPFVTHHNALDRDLYLRIAPELYLKRCVVGGLDRVYELGKNFRNEGVSYKHNPEFTSLETYEAYADYRDVAAMTETMVAAAAEAATGGTAVRFREQDIELAPPWTRIDLRDSLEQASGIDVRQHPEAAALRDAMRAKGYEAADTATWPQLVDGLLSSALEPELVQPAFLLDYPVELSPFAKRSPSDPAVVERFEAFAGGMEIANAFTELNDPDDQRARFQALVAEREAGDEEAPPPDPDFLTALEHGMPPTGGLGVGIDRLVMLLTDRSSIREVVLFPAMRSETSEPL